MENPKINIRDFRDFITRAPHLYHIRSEDNRLITYTPNESQLRLNKIIEEEKKRTKEIYGHAQIRLITLKGRQLGVSTDTGLRNIDNMSLVDLYNVQVLAHDDDTTQLLYDIYTRAYTNMPTTVDIIDDEGNIIQSDYPIRPETKSLSGKKMEFKGLGSRLNVRTAGGGDNVGKGITLNAVHLSECANYIHFKDVLSSTSQALPRKADIFVNLESTANGISGTGEGFYKLWDTSEEQWSKFKSGAKEQFDGYRPVFLPWYEHSKYLLPLYKNQMTDLDGVDFGTIGEDKYKEREEYMIDEMGLSLERVNWYRWCIKNKCSYDLNEAYRYYPTFPKDAFLATDTCFFNSQTLFTVKENLKNIGEKDHVYGEINDDIEFEIGDGNLKVYVEPDPTWENRYVIGADPSRNVEGGDYGAIFVYDRLEENFPAKWYGRMDEDKLALVMMKIGYYYNTGLLIPESNLATLVNIIKPDGLIPYNGEVYFMTVGNRLNFGFQTNKETRKLLLDDYKIWLRDNYDKIPDLSAVQEHIDFVKVWKNGRVRPEAKEGKHDDQVIAMALCIWGSDKWEEEIAKMNDEGTDYEQIITQERMRSRGKKQSQLGRKGRGRGYKYPDENKLKGKQSKLGRR